jgi:hypothetical protein
MKIKLFLIVSIIAYSCNFYNAKEQDDWTLFKNSFYKIYNNSLLNFAQAIEICASKAAVLASIDSDDEFNWLQTFIPQYSNNNIVWVKNCLCIF